MTGESYKSFLAKVQHDEGFRNELRAAGSAAIVAFAAAKGYKFKVEDVSGELTDQQLEAVAGGSINLNSSRSNVY